MTRPPIVVVMGHIDHGKTTLLDWYRNTRVAAGEAGGITQHVGAYQIEWHNKKITFLDTPGHEAFAAIRMRGVALADIALLVIAADEGVKPQTKEALSIIRAQNLPFIVVLNKSDKTDANPDRVKQQLAQEEVLVESYGGKIPALSVSAKQGTGMEELLEMLFLMAELEPRTVDIAKPAEGIIIEVKRDSRRGSSALAIVKDGTLHRNDFLAINGSMEKIKIMEDAFGMPLEEAQPSLPVRVTGLSVLPEVGSAFFAYSTRNETQIATASHDAPDTPHTKKSYIPEKETIHESSTPPNTVLSLVIKTDTAGSRQALEKTLENIQTDGFLLKIISSDIGDVNENDVKRLATSTPRIILAFGVKSDSAARELARNLNIQIITHAVIYELIDQLRAYMDTIRPVTIERATIGKITLLKIFREETNKHIIGGYVEEGIARQGMHAEIIRRKNSIGEGTIKELQKDKRPTSEIASGNQCGILFETKTELKEGDTLVLFDERAQRIGQEASNEKSP